jgi:hypothetical protein
MHYSESVLSVLGRSMRVLPGFGRREASLSVEEVKLKWVWLPTYDLHELVIETPNQSRTLIRLLDWESWISEIPNESRTANDRKPAPKIMTDG